MGVVEESQHLRSVYFDFLNTLTPSFAWNLRSNAISLPASVSGRTSVCFSDKFDSP